MAKPDEKWFALKNIIFERVVLYGFATSAKFLWVLATPRRAFGPEALMP